MPKKLSKILREKKSARYRKKSTKYRKNSENTEKQICKIQKNSTKDRKSSPKSSTKYRKIVETKKNFICKTIGESMQHVWRDSPGRKRRPESLGLLVPFISGSRWRSRSGGWRSGAGAGRSAGSSLGARGCRRCWQDELIHIKIF